MTYDFEWKFDEDSESVFIFVVGAILRNTWSTADRDRMVREARGGPGKMAAEREGGEDAAPSSGFSGLV